MLKSLLPFSAVVLFALTPTVSQGNKPQATTPEAGTTTASGPAATATNPVKPTSESQAKAKSLYQIDCTMCHGDNGNGKTDLAKSMGLTIPDFSDPKTLNGKMDGDLFNTIRNGKDKMPPEAEGRANDTMVWNLILYIRNMSKP